MIDALVVKVRVNGFKVTHKDKESVVLTNGVLRVCVFSYDFPNTNQRGRVLAEHEANFDKWSKSFYSAPIPSNDDEINVIVGDLSHIQSDLNQRSGNSFGTLSRNF